MDPAVTFRDPDLQQIAPEDQQGKGRVDKLVQVVRRDGTPAWVLIHVEIQSQREVIFAERMFCYHARIFDRERLPVVSLAVLGDDDPAWLPASFTYELWGCALELRFPTVKLLTLDTATLERTQNPFATLTLLHRDAQETRGNPPERLRRKVARYRALLRQRYDADDVRALFRFMEQLLRLDPEHAQQARATMRQVEVEETGMDTFVTSFEEIGRAEGRLEGQREMLMRLLSHKFGPIPAAHQARIATLSPEAMLALSEALLDFTLLDDLTAWLDQSGSTPGA
ncbi:MAG: DUF4351 domain-containing protein [Chloroflexales bacterium]|nr:DUF4351 domain-containing protein [Chloroflexales bacterium]